MPKSVDEQIIDQIKKMQAKIDGLEAAGASSEIAALQQEVSDLKTELAQDKKARQLKIDFGEW